MDLLSGSGAVAHVSVLKFRNSQILHGLKKERCWCCTTLALQTELCDLSFVCEHQDDLVDTRKTRQQSSGTLITASRGFVLMCVQTHVEPVSH